MENQYSKITYEFVKNSFEKEGYQLLSKDYINAHQVIDFICPKGHKHKIKWNDWQRGHRCPCSKCCRYNGVSKPEKEIVKYIKQNYLGIIKENDRTLIKNPKTNRHLELDIWLPEIRKAIEYGAEYYHNNVNTVLNDNYKQQYCKENNIDLLIIDHNKWIKNKDWNIIDSFIN